MKLKKHPKQQRMEDMTFPIIKPTNSQLRTYKKLQKDMDNAVGVLSDEGKVIWEGREWLRSINDDNGFTLMPRIVWRLVAVGWLAGAVIYFLSKYGYIR